MIFLRGVALLGGLDVFDGNMTRVVVVGGGGCGDSMGRAAAFLMMVAVASCRAYISAVVTYACVVVGILIVGYKPHIHE